MGLGEKSSLQTAPAGHDCVACGSSNAWNRNYCRCCGQPLTHGCASCFFANGVTDHFCGGCGCQITLGQRKAIGTPPPGKAAGAKERRGIPSILPVAAPKASPATTGSALKDDVPEMAIDELEADESQVKSSATSKTAKDLASRLQSINSREVKVKAPPIPVAALKDASDKAKDELGQDQIDDLFG